MKDDKTDPGSVADLRQAETALEEIVQARTAELARANLRLEREIAERMQTEEALRESEAHYRAIVEDQTELICRFLPEGTLTFVNEAFCRHLGQKREDLIGHGLPSSILQEEQVSSISPESPIVTYEHREEMSGGDTCWMRWTVRALLDGDGRIIGYQAGGRDITSRKRVEQRLRFQASALDQVQDAVIAVDNEQRVIYLNQSAVKQYHLDPQASLGCRLAELYRSEWLDSKDECAAFASLESQGSWQGESLHIKGDGERIVVESSVSVLRDADGQKAGTLAVIRDISGRKKQQAERERLLAQSVEDREAVEDLVRVLERERVVSGTIMEHTHAQLAYLDPQFNFVRVNAAYALGSGYSVQDLIGQNHFVLFPNAENQAIFERVRDTGQPAVFHAKPFVFPDRPGLGTTYWDWTLVPVMDAGGSAEGLVLSLLDVTARERARAEREAQWARNDLLVEVSERILAEKTVQGVLRCAVDAACELSDARLAVSGFISPDGHFQIGPTFRAEGTPPCLSVQAFTIRKGGVYLDLVKGRSLMRLTDEEMRQHPGWWGLPEGHVPLRGFLGVRLVGHDGRTTGVIMLSDKTEGDFTAEDEASLVQLASLTSLGLQHIEAREEAERHADELDAVFDAMLDAVMVYGADGIVTRANRVATTTVETDPAGAHRAELVRVFATRTVDGRPVVGEDLPSARALRGDTVTDERFVIRSARGNDLIVLASAAPLWKDGVVSGAVLLWHDITDQERLLAENRSQRKFLERLMEVAPVGIAVVRGPEHRYEYVNPYYQAIPGVPDGTMVGRTIREVFPEVAAQGAVGLVEQVYRTGQTASLRAYEATVGPGRERTYWDVDHVPLLGSDGQVSGVLIVASEVTEPVLARRELETERATLKAVIDNAPDGIVVTDKACRITLTNQAADRIYGRPASLETRAELLHWHADGTVCGPRDLPLARSALDGETCVNEELVIARPDGYRRDLLVNSTPIRDAEGRISGAVGVLHDVTELKQTQKALRRYADRLRLLREADRAILASSSVEETARAVLPYLRQLVPCMWASVTTFDEQTGQVSVLATVADGRTEPGRGWRGPLEEAWFLSQLRSGQVYREESTERLASSPLFEALRGRGERAFWSIPLAYQDRVLGSLNLGMADPGPVAPEHADVLLEIAGELTIGIRQIELHDQVRRHADELERIVTRRTAALQASQARLQAIYDGAPLGIVLVGSDGRIVESNPAFGGIVGYSADELQGKGLVELTHPGNVHPDLGLFEELMADQRDRYQLEKRYIRKDGRAVWVALSVTAIQAGEGQQRLALKMVEDITERRQAREALVQAEKLSATGRLAASLAHEINNPLQAVIGCLDLAEGALAEEGDPRRYLEVAQQELSRAARVVRQLRDLHRRSGAVERELGDVNALVEQVLEVAAGQCKRHRVEVEWSRADDLPLLSVVPDQLQQVFLNLILNAVEAMPEGGRLQVSTTRTDVPGGIEVRFADTGVGISSDHLPHLFEPFHTTRPDGLGLGLYISHNIVQHHGGRVEVESTVGRGTTFTVWLPQ